MENNNTNIRLITTKPTSWKNKDTPVIVLVSINSKFHEGERGRKQFEEFINYIYCNVNSHITILLGDGAHLEVDSLEQNTSLDEIKIITRNKALNLLTRFENVLKGKDVKIWSDFITKDSKYNEHKNYIRGLYEQNVQFSTTIRDQAKMICIDRASDINNITNEMIEATADDLMELCIYMLIVSEKGYCYQFYPGKSGHHVTYTNKFILAPDKQVKWIDVHLYEDEEL